MVMDKKENSPNYRFHVINFLIVIDVSSGEMLGFKNFHPYDELWRIFRIQCNEDVTKDINIYPRCYARNA